MSNKRPKLNLMPPWLTGTSESIKTEAIRLYSMDPDVLRTLTVDYSQIVLKALGVRRPFRSYALVLASAAHTRRGRRFEPLACVRRIQGPRSETGQKIW
jgi:hypothetical protein